MTIEESSQFPAWLNNFIVNYQLLSTSNLELLSKIYAEDIEFNDAVHKLEGLTELEEYFKHLYTNLRSCSFDITDAFFQQDKAAVYWQMTYEHKSLNRGKAITIEGHSVIKGSEDKVHYHKDYLDMGAMVYEHIPVLGRFVKAIKLRMNHAA